jgi:hypothetical protein
MKRTPLKRTKSLKSSSGPAKRGKRVKRAVWWLKDLFGYRDGVRREVEREARENVFGEKADWIRAQPCMCCAVGFSRPSEAAHVRSRGAGGTSKDLVPLCRKHHQMQHDMGVHTFAKQFGFLLTMDDFARIYEEEWQAERRFQEEEA